MNARHLPAAQNQIRRPVPVISKSTPLAERQLIDITCDKAMFDVELGQPAIGPYIVAVLRFTKGSRIDARAAAAGRDVVRRAGQRLAPGVTDESRQSA